MHLRGMTVVVGCSPTMNVLTDAITPPFRLLIPATSARLRLQPVCEGS